MNLSTQIPHEEIRARKVVIYPGEDGYWVAECPGLPGCVSQGKDKEEAAINIREAIQLYIEVLEEDDLPIPKERHVNVKCAICSWSHENLRYPYESLVSKHSS